MPSNFCCVLFLTHLTILQGFSIRDTSVMIGERERTRPQVCFLRVYSLNVKMPSFLVKRRLSMQLHLKGAIA